MSDTLSMHAVAEPAVADPLVLHLRPAIEMSEDQFFEFCQLNRDLRIERTAEGDILIMSPTGWETGSGETELAMQLRAWAKRDGTGVGTGSSTGFLLPDGSMLSPDGSWVRGSRLAGLTRDQRKKFLPLCPDFVVELRSPSDRLSALKRKTQQWIDNGALLGWLIDPEPRVVYVYRPGKPVAQLDHPDSVSADPELPGFVFDLADIWEPAL